MVIPAGALHFVMSFTPSLALSSDFVRESAYDMAVERSFIFKECYKQWPEDERQGADARTEKGLKAWDKLLGLRV
jgi:hypothetical protein